MSDISPISYPELSARKIISFNLPKTLCKTLQGNRLYLEIYYFFIDFRATDNSSIVNFPSNSADWLFVSLITDSKLIKE